MALRKVYHPRLDKRKLTSYEARLVRRLLMQTRITQAEIGKLSGIAQSTVSAIGRWLTYREVF